MKKQLDLFEYNPIEIDVSLKNDLERALDYIWNERGKYYDLKDRQRLSIGKKQQYAKFEKTSIIVNNYIGSVQYRNNGELQKVNFLPKIFYDKENESGEVERKNIFLHILWWLSNSDKQFYVSNNLSLDSIPSDFIEAYMFMFATYTVEILSVNAYQYYHTVEEDIETIRGQINFNQYLKNYSKGNIHKISCVYDSFQYDNLFNRIVKFVCVELLQITKLDKTVQKLNEIIFLLDEVELVNITIEDCDQVSLNPIYTELITILDYCKLFLSSLSSYSNKNDFSVMGLLIPTEKLYENLLLSIWKKNFIKDIKAVRKNKVGRQFLAMSMPNGRDSFKMINDIVIELNVSEFQKEKFIIFDAKYKNLTNLKEIEETSDDYNENYNILQNDMYQMVSYAVSKKVKNIGLFYPLLKDEEDYPNLNYFEIKDEFSNDAIIRVFPFKINICHEERLNISAIGKLENVFEKTKEKLIFQLNESVKKIIDIQMNS